MTKNIFPSKPTNQKPPYFSKKIRFHPPDSQKNLRNNWSPGQPLPDHTKSMNFHAQHHDEKHLPFETTPSRNPQKLLHKKRDFTLLLTALKESSHLAFPGSGKPRLCLKNPIFGAGKEHDPLGAAAR